MGIALVAMLVACSSESDGQGGGGTSLVGNWAYVNEAGTAGLGATFNSDNTYSAFTLFLTSASSADAELETGTYSVSGKNIVFTPKQWTCPGPGEITSYAHSFGSGGNLILTTPSGIINMERNTATASDSFVIRFGCYDSKTKTFTPSELAPVSN